MNKSVRRAKLRLGIGVDEEELEWNEKQNAPYKYHAILTYKPANMFIEQASENSMAEARGYCIRELGWRMKHWEDWQKSGVRESD